MKKYNPIIFTTDLECRFEKTNYQNQNTNELSVNIINTFTNSLEYIAPMEILTRKETKKQTKPMAYSWDPKINQD